MTRALSVLIWSREEEEHRQRYFAFLGLSAAVAAFARPMIHAYSASGFIGDHRALQVAKVVTSCVLLLTWFGRMHWSKAFACLRGHGQHRVLDSAVPVVDLPPSSEERVRVAEEHRAAQRALEAGHRRLEELLREAEMALDLLADPRTMEVLQGDTQNSVANLRARFVELQMRLLEDGNAISQTGNQLRQFCLDQAADTWEICKLSEFGEGVADCGICLEPLQCEDQVRTLPCGHRAFHASCLEEYFSVWAVSISSSSGLPCPLCRRPVIDHSRTLVDAAPVDTASVDVPPVSATPIEDPSGHVTSLAASPSQSDVVRDETYESVIRCDGS